LVKTNESEMRTVPTNELNGHLPKEADCLNKSCLAKAFSKLWVIDAKSRETACAVRYARARRYFRQSYPFFGVTRMASVMQTLLALAAGLVALNATAGQVNTQSNDPTDNPPSAVSTILLKADHSWDGTPYTHYPAGRPQLTVLKIVVPPHTSLPWHRHPMPNAAYVVSGTLTVETRDGRHRITLHAGDALPEMVDQDHRGTTGDAPVELIVFYAGAAGMPLSIKAE
jgi:quercetin dioxygenase-like cupin family protein